MADLGDFERLVKICGVTNVEDAALALSAGADAVGVILTASVRHVSVARAREIFASVTSDRVRVGVVRSGEEELVERALTTGSFDAIQIHGSLEPAMENLVRGQGVGLIHAISLGGPASPEPQNPRADALLLDGPVPGSGRAHSWEGYETLGEGTRVIAAGGLTPDSVGALIERLDPWGVDVASGVESSPGRKDPQRVVDFVREARRAFEVKG